MSSNSSLRDAVNYVLHHAEPEGLGVECLKELLDELYIRMENNALSKDDYTTAAEIALYEWGI